MKKLIATTALITAVAAPLAAETQLETLVGANAGEYSTSQLAELYFAQNNDEDAPYFGGTSAATVSSKSSINPVAEAQFAQIAAQDGEDYGLNTVTVYGNAAVNDRAAAIFADIDAE